MIATAKPQSPTLSEALQKYQEVYLTSRNLAQRTRSEYSHDIADLISFLQTKCAVDEPIQVERRHLEAYLAELDRRGFTGSTRRRKVASIRSFFSFLEDEEAISQSPARKLIPPEREYYQPRVLTDKEYKRLQLACTHDIRNAALIELLLQTGARLSEVAKLTLQDIELPAKVTKDEGNVGSARIFGKGRKERTVTLNWKACKAIKSYLQIRPKVEDNHLFITKFGTGISPRAIRYTVKEYLGQASISNASVHTLRHTFATHMVKSKVSLAVVRDALGHASLKTTSIYVGLAREAMDKELQANAL
jgi:site-specific recombinase XerD